MGGRIGCESTPGQGASFRFELDLKKAESSLSEPAPLPPAEATAPAGPQILLVEDNLINQVVAEAMLKKLGYGGIRLAANGSEALDSLRQAPFDLVLMDCQMPVMDGYEATRRIRRGEGGDAGIPIVAVTAHVLEEDRQQCLASGMDDYLAKPFSPVELAGMLQRWLPRKFTGAALG